MMNWNGNSLAALKMYEAQVIPALLFNSESWIGLTDTHISDLQNFQDKFPQTATLHTKGHLAMGLRNETDKVENS